MGPVAAAVANGRQQGRRRRGGAAEADIVRAIRLGLGADTVSDGAAI
jgi:NitT/TauT family transport system ATP-binding protein